MTTCEAKYYTSYDCKQDENIVECAEKFIKPHI